MVSYFGNFAKIDPIPVNMSPALAPLGMTIILVLVGLVMVGGLIYMMTRGRGDQAIYGGYAPGGYAPTQSRVVRRLEK